MSPVHTLLASRVCSATAMRCAPVSQLPAAGNCETIPVTIIGLRKIFADHYVCGLVTNQYRSGYLAVRYLKMFNNDLVLFCETQVTAHHFY